MCGETTEVDSLHATSAVALVTRLIGKMFQANQEINYCLVCSFLKYITQVFKMKFVTPCVRGTPPVTELVMLHAFSSVLW